LRGANRLGIGALLSTSGFSWCCQPSSSYRLNRLDSGALLSTRLKFDPAHIDDALSQSPRKRRTSFYNVMNLGLACIDLSQSPRKRRPSFYLPGLGIVGWQLFPSQSPRKRRTSFYVINVAHIADAQRFVSIASKAAHFFLLTRTASRTPSNPQLSQSPRKRRTSFYPGASSDTGRNGQLGLNRLDSGALLSTNEPRSAEE